MTLHQIHMFLQLAESLSFTEVAKQNYISQPTLSKQISKLEEELGVSLFNRSYHSLKLTSAGELFRDEMSRINVDIENATAAVRRVSSKADGKLSVGVVNLLSPSDIERVISPNFAEQHPKVELELFLCGYKSLRTLIVEQAVDFIISTKGELSNFTSVESKLLWKSTPAVVVREDSKFAKWESISLEDLRDEFFVVLDQKESSSALHTLLQACQHRRFYPKISKFASGIPVSMIYVEIGYGVTISDMSRAVFDLKGSRYKVIPISNDDCHLFSNQDVYLAWDKRNTNPLLPRFLDLWTKSGNE